MRLSLPDAGRMRELLGTALLIAGVWTAVAILGTVQYTGWESKDEAGVLEAVALNGAFAAGWALAMPVALAGASMLVSARSARTRLVAVLVLLGAAFAAYALRFVVLGGDLLQALTGGGSNVVSALLENLFVVLVLVFLSHHARMRRLNEEQRRAEAELSGAVAQMQLQQLRAGLEPHFLFNALNSVAALIRDDPPAARAMMRQLSDLLERCLLSQQRREIPLGEELAFARDYLAIQKIRFRDRLDVRFAIDPALDAVPVPPLILQPLIENAVVHGIARSELPGVIEVSAARQAGRLLLTVRDTGAGFGFNPPAGGIGIANVRARLALQYGTEQRLDFRHDGKGFVALVELPIALPAKLPVTGHAA